MGKIVYVKVGNIYKPLFTSETTKRFIMLDKDIRVVSGGTATGVQVAEYTSSETTSLKQELVTAGKYTAEELQNASVLNITGTTAGTVILDVSRLGNVGANILVLHKKSNNTWEELYKGEIPASGQVTVTLTEFSPIVGAKKADSPGPGPGPEPFDPTVPLCFTAQEANSTIKLKKTGSLTIKDTAYSTDGTNWITYTPSTSPTLITLSNVGDKIYFRNTNGTYPGYGENNYLTFIMTGKISASGNCNSMHDGTNFSTLTSLKSYCYHKMFNGCTSLTTAPALPATTLAYNCYHSMFQGCTSLTTVPELPATTLINYCYYKMFFGCTSLTTAPTLPVTALAKGCYKCMFEGCTALTTAPALPVTTLAEQCYSYMFYGCTSLTTAPALPATTLASSCYSYMFYGCTSLTATPALPATTLASSCYYSMFYYCSSLTTVPVLPATTLISGCYSQMFYYCNLLQVSDTQTSSATYQWVIPHNGVFTNTTSHSSTFSGCAGKRAVGGDFYADADCQCIYYTQNPPIS